STQSEGCRTNREGRARARFPGPTPVLREYRCEELRSADRALATTGCTNRAPVARAPHPSAVLLGATLASETTMSGDFLIRTSVSARRARAGIGRGTGRRRPRARLAPAHIRQAGSGRRV